MTAKPSSPEIDRPGLQAHPAPKDEEAVRHAVAEPKSSSPAIWTGVYLGALLNIVMIAALVAANRFPNLEPYALERNAASYGLFVLFLLIPVIRFLKRPAEMFASGFVGWVLFVAGYRIAGFYFHNLFQVLRTPFEALIEGCVLYGVAAVTFWVVGMIFEVRRHPIALRRRPAHPAVHTRP
jgi:hypothetical protein